MIQSGHGPRGSPALTRIRPGGPTQPATSHRPSSRRWRRGGARRGERKEREQDTWYLHPAPPRLEPRRPHRRSGRLVYSYRSPLSFPETCDQAPPLVRGLSLFLPTAIQASLAVARLPSGSYSGGEDCGRAELDACYARVGSITQPADPSGCVEARPPLQGGACYRRAGTSHARDNHTKPSFRSPAAARRCLKTWAFGQT
jgi:hypothetical protein